MHVKVEFTHQLADAQFFENVTDVDDTGGAFKMVWEAEGGPGHIITYMPWHRIRQVEVQKGYDE